MAGPARSFCPTVSDGAPIGPRGVALLRRVRLHGGAYPLDRNADHEHAGRAIAGGFLRRDGADDFLVHLTPEGSAYLDQLMRVE